MLRRRKICMYLHFYGFSYYYARIVERFFFFENLCGFNWNIDVLMEFFKVSERDANTYIVPSCLLRFPVAFTLLNLLCRWHYPVVFFHESSQCSQISISHFVSCLSLVLPLLFHSLPSLTPSPRFLRKLILSWYDWWSFLCYELWSWVSTVEYRCISIVIFYCNFKE